MVGRKGISLIEMVTAIFIIVLLALIVVPLIEKHVLHAKVARIEQDIEKVNAIWRKYWLDTEGDPRCGAAHSFSCKSRLKEGGYLWNLDRVFRGWLDWEIRKGTNGNYFLAIFSRISSARIKEAAELDSSVDDGNPNEGCVRWKQKDGYVYLYVLLQGSTRTFSPW